MPPRKSRRRLEPPQEENTAEEPKITPKTNTEDPNAGVPLAQLPPELFDAIIETYVTLPPTFYYDTHDIPDSKYYERNDALTALSQTCTALRDITLPRLWARLDICRVPKRAQGTWYKYTMQAIEGKANGIAVSPVRHHVRTLTLMFSKSQPDAPLAALWAMLPKLPNLRTIQVITCKTPGFAKSLADSKLALPNVTTLLIPDQVSALQRICPNATHVRCGGGSGAALISALTNKTEVFDGMVDWKILPLVDRLAKKAPNLRKLELRRPVNSGLGIESQNKVPEEWSKVIPKLALLKKLVELVLTFPAAEDKPGDAALVEAARTLMRDKSAVAGERRLVVRHVVARHYTRREQDEDVVTSCTTETFE
ncbi:hypothetical protein DFH08DRAFT_896079 [Mycena albidolilacea]|uniref:F-box domain-containing protein n=1 Tax=Mycena albidolilacea TaxID=1033008 RepID=A0AAD7ECY0_9AGAR|nr:hypothetical protein DFH08DRAFT_896079 [Mycena albidolilacea]